MAPETQVDDAHTISGQGIGAAIVGSSLGNMQAQLGASFDFVDVGPIVVDVDGYEVRQDGELQFYAGQVAGETGLNFLLVDNPDAGFGETNEFVDGATIASVWVSCVPGRDCPVNRLPDTSIRLIIFGFALIAGGTLVLHGARRSEQAEAI